ncbi:MAG: thymidine phosphorylase [Pirellulales bacterium]|nr:thymidine phosphorylase [Pirellulales bacterium]
MNPVAIITKKRDGGALLPEEIAAFIEGFVRSDVADYQMSALAMAIYFRGMDAAERSALIEAMLDSGSRLEWPDGFGTRVDKHSTGGVGDKISLPLAPMLACCGLKVPMISGRGLGTTGGTLDKLESIPGLRTNLSTGEIYDVVDRVGCVITGATADLVPADRKLYALRDVTGTVSSIPLICASIMSKKLAENLDALVLDVKWGSGALMKKQHDARELANAMVEIGTTMGVHTTALLTDMNQPHGVAAGHVVEVEEALEVLRGEGPEDVVELCLALGAELLVSTGLEKSHSIAADRLRGLLESGRPLEKFREMVIAQGGDLDSLPPHAPSTLMAARHGGYVSAIDTEQLGSTLIEMGGGRKKLRDKIDHSVGLAMLIRLGDRIERGQPMARIFAPPEKTETSMKMLADAITISTEPTSAPPLIVERIGMPCASAPDAADRPSPAESPLDREPPIDR